MMFLKSEWLKEVIQSLKILKLDDILTFSFTGNFGPSIPNSNWLIFCCRYLKLYQKKINENDKSINFAMKHKKRPKT